MHCNQIHQDKTTR